MRYNPTGTLDATFGSGGIQTTTSATGSYTPDQDLGNVLIDAGGKILVGARLSNNSGGGGFAVVRYTAAGSPDATFGINGLIFRSAPDRFGGAIRLQSDGGIVQAGTVPDSTNTHERNAIVFHYANAAAGLVVQNVAPSASVTSAATGAPHQPFFMDFALDDVSSADRAAGIAVSIDWGDGSPVDTANPFPTGVTPGARVYNEAGTYTITFTATDKDGGTTVATTTFTITTTAVVADDVNGGQMLIVSGGRSSGAGGSNSNVIDLRPAAGGVRVNVDGAITDIAASIGRVVVYGNGGDDTITVSGSISLPVEFYGGDGDDSLRAGGRDDILSGGPGADLLVGGNGRDIVIGGLGVDRIVGNSDDDILIGGTLAGEELWPDFGVDRFSLSLIRSEWTSSHTYAQRVANLRDGSGTPGQALNDGAYLVADVTVLDDDAADVLTGDSGSDWFFANVDGSPPDVITDLTSKEFVDDLDFINAV